MRFASRKDTFFKVLIYGVCLLLFILLVEGVLNWNEESPLYFFVATMSIVIGMLLWMFHGTFYTLNQDYVGYRMAFLHGKIPLDSITELEVGTTMWAGYKPATARKGIVLKYNKYDEIYISPDSNERFVEELLKWKPEVKIKYSSKN